MIIVVDSGSTKTDWWGWSPETGSVRLKTEGLNPVVLSPEKIRERICLGLPPALTDTSVEAVYFYGSGCGTTERKEILSGVLTSIFPKAQIEVEHDLLGAARAACGREEGLVAILGTGSNSCYFDGNAIRWQQYSLGYLLGDEGAGVDLGKRLLRARSYGQLPETLSGAFDRFLLDLGVEPDQLVTYLYRHPSPPVFLASFTPFLKTHESETSIRKLILAAFAEFLDLHLLQFVDRQVPVHFIGSVAWIFKEQLIELTDARGLLPGKWIRKPIRSLFDYHIGSYKDKKA